MEENIINYMNNIEKIKLSKEDKEFEKYLKFFKERFGRNAYIAEPSGTRQQTIEAIKKCLELNKDILDDLYYSDILNNKRKRCLKMIIENKEITTKDELLELIKNGVNPLEFIKEDVDIDFLSNALIITGNDEDSYYEETTEIVFKSIIYYVVYSNETSKTIQRCIEIAKLLNTAEGFESVKDMVLKEERANVLFKPVEIASNKTRKDVFEKLNERLSNLI